LHAPPQAPEQDRSGATEDTRRGTRPHGKLLSCTEWGHSREREM
jgi:hypothetical protein